MDSRELAAFLRTRRERLAPAEVGLPAGRQRRTPGLRREEVAQLTYISVEYYTRLEQARASRPSRRVLAGIAMALRLNDAEITHLHHLAGQPPGHAAVAPHIPRTSVLELVHRLPGAAILLDATYEVIAWNSLAMALMEDFTALAPRQRNLIRRHFLNTGRARLYGLLPQDSEMFGAVAVGHLREAAARYPDDPRITELVNELSSRSTDFARLWASHDVSAQRHLRKTFEHPAVGPLELNCDALLVPEQDQQIIVYTADPGTPSEQALHLLAVIGTQHMPTSPEA
ncbi:helix-turn-helix transcriptional regulator [Streptomyces mirabilis]|uniref:helix-turn-helix transcriptional regulator n=1 Tax=Streptomyces mirabilis TaxID=68239 RepID=UPI0036625CDD